MDIQRVKDDIEEAITNCDDLMEAYDYYECDSYLDALRRQLYYFIDIIDDMDIYTYGYHRYRLDVMSIEEEDCEETLNGRLNAIDYVHFKINYMELFEGYPDREDLYVQMQKNKDKYGVY